MSFLYGYAHQFGSEEAGSSNMTSKQPFTIHQQSNTPRTYKQTMLNHHADDDGSITFSLSSWANMDLTSQMADPSDRLYNSDGAFQYTENGIVLIKNMPKLHVNSSKNTAYYKYHDENSSCADLSLSSWAVLSLSSGAYNNSNGDPSSNTPPPPAPFKNKILPLNHARTKATTTTTTATTTTATTTTAPATNKRSSCKSNMHSEKGAPHGTGSTNHHAATDQERSSPSLLPKETLVQDQNTAMMKYREGEAEEKRPIRKHGAAVTVTAATDTTTSLKPSTVLIPSKRQKQLVTTPRVNRPSSQQIMVPQVKTTTRRTILPSNPTRRLLAIRSPLTARK